MAPQDLQLGGGPVGVGRAGREGARPVEAARIASSMPMRRATSRPAPRTSMFCPSSRSSSKRSTTVVCRPWALSQPGSGYVEGLVRPGDIEIVKRTVGAFEGTGLDGRLRERCVDTVVLAGLVTTMGVAATAWAASDRGYEVEFVADAMSGFAADEHTLTVERVFSRIGEVRTTASYL
ncbi:cysteine hydrolase [Streptomyces sp. H27-G5]|uniref:cysteine hydrolase family protein n=1 Tax=Streptomyces sp. H27-G5 TaxID=2996698 RepID=UPI00227014C5|nr:isochorismatase family cysteine hydrolase [Streptomyces sp. H27-G5]MCY0922668.1 cysteine hydrolase [Streptomyces sp. H27-G5]